MMLRLGTGVCIYVASQAIDFRKAINGLTALISEEYETAVQKEQTIQTVQHPPHLFRTARFGRKSEKGVIAEQLALQFG